MGEYFTSTSISITLPGFLKGTDGGTTTSDTTGSNIFMRQVNHAEAEVNAAINSRYDIAGLSAIPPLLIKLTEAIAIYNVIKRTGYRADDRNEYMDDFKSAKDTLGELKEGKINLAFTDGSSVGVLSTSRFLTSSQGHTPIAGLDKQKNWKVDKDLLDDLATERQA